MPYYIGHLERDPNLEKLPTWLVHSGRKSMAYDPGVRLEPRLFGLQDLRTNAEAWPLEETLKPKP